MHRAGMLICLAVLLAACAAPPVTEVPPPMRPKAIPAGDPYCYDPRKGISYPTIRGFCNDGDNFMRQ